MAKWLPDAPECRPLIGVWLPNGRWPQRAPGRRRRTSVWWHGRVHGLLRLTRSRRPGRQVIWVAGYRAGGTRMALQSKSEGQYEPLAPDLDVGPLQAADRTGGLSKNHLALLLLIAALSLMVVEALTAYQVLEGIAQRDPATLTGEAQTREALHVVTGQVQNAKNLVLWTTVAVTGGLILILLGFFTVATMRISRSSRREASAIEARQQERERAKEAVNLVEQQLRTVVKNSPLMVFASIGRANLPGGPAHQGGSRLAGDDRNDAYLRGQGQRYRTVRENGDLPAHSQAGEAYRPAQGHRYGHSPGARSPPLG